MSQWPSIVERGARRRLCVDGEPFLALGIQVDFRNCTRPDDYDYLFEHVVRLGCNTLFFPVQWFVIEPEEGRFDWTVPDHALARCREHGLRMALLWFGTNQGGSWRPAPRWVKEDGERFRRMAGRDGAPLDGLCPSCGATLEAEKRAFDALLAHLRDADRDEHTVILLQIENEPCIRMNADGRGEPFDEWQERCGCPECGRLCAESGLGDWEFGVRSLAGHLDALLADKDRLLPVPAYANFPINPLRPGEDVALYLAHCPRLSFVAPDYYGFSQGDLAFCMQYFAQGRNVLFVAEHSTESVGEAARNLYLCVLEHGAQGFDPWAIDAAFGWRAWRDKVQEPPFVGRDGTWSGAAVRYGCAQRALRAAHRQIARALGTDDLMHFVSHGVERKIEERRWGLWWRFDAGERGQWVCVRTGDGDVTVAGTETRVAIRPLAPGLAALVEGGRWDENAWTAERRVPAEGAVVRFDVGDGWAFRVRLAPEEPGSA